MVSALGEPKPNTSAHKMASALGEPKPWQFAADRSRFAVLRQDILHSYAQTEETYRKGEIGAQVLL